MTVHQATSDKKISVVTSARSDFGLLLPLMEAIESRAGLALCVLATGVHFLDNFGLTICEISESPVAHRVVELPTGINPTDERELAKAIGGGTDKFAEYFSEQKPDLLVILGDRFDALPAALAALPFGIPVAHISGGEITEGAIDDYFRHMLTKLSHLHFTATSDYARRVVQLGEQPDRVHSVGEPGLDVIRQMKFLDRNEVFERIGLSADAPLSLFTYHPETSDPSDNVERIRGILAAAAGIESQILFTYPNGDPGSEDIITEIEAFCAARATSLTVPSLGRVLYLNALKQSDCVVGNSSSGIVETASFNVPTVNIGARQKGRVQAENVINTDYSLGHLSDAWRKALSPTFRVGLNGLVNPYGDGRTVERIIPIIERALQDGGLWNKRFHDIEFSHA